MHGSLVHSTAYCQMGDFSNFPNNQDTAIGQDTQKTPFLYSYTVISKFSSTIAHQVATAW